MNCHDQVQYIQRCMKKYPKIRAVGANFGRSLYHNILYEDPDVDYISLKKYEFNPYMEGDNIICHPNNTLEKVYNVAGRAGKMIYGTPLFYPLSIGGIIFNGAVGGHVKSRNAASYVNKLWIVDGYGQDIVIMGEDLKYHLCTFGYLGIAYKISLQTFPEQYFRIMKQVSSDPYTHNTHMTQMVFAKVTQLSNEQIIPMISDVNKPRYIDIVLEPSDKTKETSRLDLSLQNIKKTGLFILEGIVTTFHSAIISSFMNIFIPMNESVVNSRDLVYAYPLLPKLVLEYVQLNLECGIYVLPDENFEAVLKIIEDFYKKYFYQDYDCINILMRKIKTNQVCYLDATYNDEGEDEVILIDFGFFNGTQHKNIIDEEIKKMIPYAYSFHLGKYVNEDILNFMKQKFGDKMKSMKQRFDPTGVFSTKKLDELFNI